MSYRQDDSDPEPKPARSPISRPPERGATSSVPWLISLVVLVGAAAVVVYFVFVRSTTTTTTVTVTTPTTPTGKSGKPGARAARFQFAFPKDWKQVKPNTVAPGQHAFAAVRQKAGRGVVVMQAEPAVSNLSGKYLANLEVQLAKTVPDYKLIGSHSIQLKGGSALDVTYERTKLKEVRNVVILPATGRSIVMATIAAVGDAKTTKEISQIVSSFTLLP